ncbi:hypothetical protein [uncultured Halopseudomonas sp.]|uniref:hypothetical protein n=1 Tax=uncultured Halopseudomonas sp. TaxID=2901193 RepID=UPI0030EF8075|tara:strand:- start:483 stop:800 length:318 start_codon:yes stop_codon:yes gene_type:complete
MNLTEQEQRHLENLKKTEESFYRWRYLNLGMGVISLLLAFGGLLFLSSLSSELGARFGNHPMFYLLAILGGVGIGLAVRGWRGNSANRLLIAVLEELTRHERNKA